MNAMLRAARAGRLRGGRVRLDAAGGVEGASVLRPLPSCVLCRPVPGRAREDRCP